MSSAKANSGPGTDHSSTGLPAAERETQAALDLYNPSLTAEDKAQPLGRVLALDVGKKRIGLAVSDELGITAQGLQTLERTRIRDDLKSLRQLAVSLNVQTILIGKPLHMSGSDSRQSEYTREFGERLGEHTGLAIVFRDERLTTAEAERLLRAGGASLEVRKKSVDRMAAVLLLESYLENRAASLNQEDEERG